MRVAILDLDSGQPELSPPGVLNLTILTGPLLSDPPMHIMGAGGIVERVVSLYFLGARSFFQDQNNANPRVNGLKKT